MVGSTGVHTVQADTDTDKDYELDLSGIEAWDTYNDAELTGFESLREGDITYTRTHVLATSGIHYETDHLIVSAKPLTYTGTITDDTPVTAGMGKEDYATISLSGKEDVADKMAGTLTTTYSFTNEDLNLYAKAAGVEPTEGADGEYYIYVYISHVFRISPSSDAEFEKLKSLSAAYKDLTTDLSWYKTYNEFFAPGGDTTFWSGGSSVAKMKACVNIRIKIKANPNVYKSRLHPAPCESLLQAPARLHISGCPL